ncbi:hemerythrin domain-containing protein [Nonomuraea sp. NPDC049269]|uniref:hemerythrin domain-containing protein n=1 Tax=Nonomuraea sp. NPDC049269 TaxID=3364349 RepID=UPI00372109A4
MDAIVLLKDDHKTVEGLFKKFEQAGEKAYAEKRRIVDKFTKELVTHAHIEEEKDWFPQVRAAMGRKELQELGERMEAARAEAPAEPLAVKSAAQ